jgi:hypothetical protein
VSSCTSNIRTLFCRRTSLRESGTIIWRFLQAELSASVCLVPLALAPAPPPARRCHYPDRGGNTSLTSGTNGRQRDAFLSPLWRILVDRMETFVDTYDGRFADTYGPLKPYAEKAFGSLLLCGDPNLGVTRFSCCSFGVELGVPFSCKTREESAVPCPASASASACQHY